MKLAIDETRCKGCNLCTKVCPYKIFKEGKKLNRKGIAIPELDRPERCANCRLQELLRAADSAVSASSPARTRQFTGSRKNRTNPIRWRLNIDTRLEFWQGNTACAEGALAAGCNFFGGYPITPSTEVAEHMAAKLPKKGGVFIQMEDEIASMASIIGASWTGARAMTATSGPGFSLMMENIGFAAMTETPCVVVNVQRGGPSTGQPTMSAQGDMMQVRFGSHGDYAIIALCPATVQEMYELTVKAFNLADKYRVPVFLMADETVGHMREKIIIPDKVERVGRKPLVPGTLPFKADADLIPGFRQFGKGHHVHVTGLTHDERGYPCATNPKLHAALVQRLVDKIENARHEMADYDIINPDA